LSTPAKGNNSPSSELGQFGFCLADGSGQQGGGRGGHTVANSNTGTKTFTGGEGDLGGGHFTATPSDIKMCRKNMPIIQTIGLKNESQLYSEILQ